MAESLKNGMFPVEMRLAHAAGGDSKACFELGMMYSAGAKGVEIDLVQAHKWFNLAALGGYIRGQECRAEISEEMSAREIAEAQRQARAWIAMTNRQAA